MKENNPIDNHFKEHLENIEVQPSSDLWSKMEPRLDESPSRKGWFIGIAASVTIAIAVSSYIYDTYQMNPNTIDIPMVIEPEEDVQPSSTPPNENIIEDATPEPSASDVASETPASIAPKHEPATPSRTAVASNRSTPQNQDETNTIAAEPSTTENRVLAEATPAVKTRVSINPNKYLNKNYGSTANADTDNTSNSDQSDQQTETEKIALDEYAEQQLDNLLNGKSVEVPEKEQIRWPELSINLSPIIQKFSPNQDNSSTQP